MFFDIIILSAEKAKTGRDQQRYTGKINYIWLGVELGILITLFVI